MNPKRKTLLILVVVFVLLSLACSLGSIAGGVAPTTNGGGSSSGVDQDQFTGDFDFPLVRKDKSNFSPGQFVASNMPIEVVFSSNLSAQVVFKGALAEPNYNLSDNPPKKVSLFFVLQKDEPSVLYREGESIKAHKWVMDYREELLDSGGNVLSKVEYKRLASLFPNYPQAFKIYFNEIPQNTTSIRVTISMVNEPLPVSCPTPDPSIFCATASDLDFEIPSPFVLHTPVQISLKMGTWNETYEKKAVLGEFFFKYKNPLNRALDYRTTMLFLDDSETLVGFFEDEYPLDANATYNRNQYGDFYHSSYFSAVPTHTLVYTTVKLTDLIEAVR